MFFYRRRRWGFGLFGMGFWGAMVMLVLGLMALAVVVDALAIWALIVGATYAVKGVLHLYRARKARPPKPRPMPPAPPKPDPEWQACYDRALAELDEINRRRGRG